MISKNYINFKIYINIIINWKFYEKVNTKKNKNF